MGRDRINCQPLVLTFFVIAQASTPRTNHHDMEVDDGLIENIETDKDRIEISRRSLKAQR